MNVPPLLSAIFVRCGLAQAALLPLMLLSWFVLPRNASLRFQWILHRAIVVLAVVLPIVFAFPVIPASTPLRGEEPAPATIQPLGAPERSRGDQAASNSPPLVTPEASALSPIEIETRPVIVTITLADVLSTLPLILAALSGLGLFAFVIAIGRQAVRERTLIRSARSIRRIGMVRVVTLDELPSPFSTGLARPRIYLPISIARRPLARRMVLAHEAIHVREAHIAWTFLERLGAAMFWFNPLAHLLATSGARLRELLCDRAAGKIRGEAAYCRVLLDAADLASRGADPLLANGWIGRRFLRRRVEFLASGLGKRTRSWIAAVAPIAVLASLAVIVGCGPRVLPRTAGEQSLSGGDVAKLRALGGSVDSLSKAEGAWPGGVLSTTSSEEGPAGTYTSKTQMVGEYTPVALAQGEVAYPESRDWVMDTAANGWNLGTGRMYNLWAGPEMRTVLGVENPEGFSFVVEGGSSVDAARFNDDIHAVVAGMLFHLPFLQRVWAGLRSTEPDLQGETGFVLSVNADGVVTTADPDPAKPGNAKLAKAYAAAMPGWRLTMRPPAAAYRVRIPIISDLQTFPGINYRLMTLRLGNQVGELREGGLSPSYLPGLALPPISTTWNDAFGKHDGTVLIAMTIAPSGELRSWKILDRDSVDARRAEEFARTLCAETVAQLLPVGTELELVVLAAMVADVVEPHLLGWELILEVFTPDRYGLRYGDDREYGFTGPQGLALPRGTSRVGLLMSRVR